MSKVIKLTESDIQHIVKRVLKEQINVPVPVKGKLKRDNNTVTSATVEFKDVDVIPFLIGSLIVSGGVLITKLIRNKKQKQLNELLKDINVALESELEEKEYKCISNKLSKMGRITKLNDTKKNTQTTLALNACLGDMDRVSEVKTFLDDYIQKIENQKNYLKGLKKIK